jgi:cadmium resistance protein CadD (predicted permease)
VSATSLLGVAAVTFVGTNIDNLAVTAAQFAAAPAHRLRRLTAGQLTGFLVILGASAGGAAILSALPVRWVGLLGLVPLALGLRGLLALRRPAEARDPRWPVAGGFFTAALVTVGSGGDNLAVTIAVLRQGDPGHGAFVAVCLVALDLLATGGAFLLGRHPRTLRLVERGTVVLTPLARCAIGVFVLARAGTFAGL